MVEPVRSHGIALAITRAAQATGVDFSHLLETARRESSLDPQAKASTSSAAGLFQFVDRTWLEMVRRHGADHGLAWEAGQISLEGGKPIVRDPKARQAILDLRYDPEVAARMAGELTRENAGFLERRLGRSPQAGELYAAHVLGPAGAASLIQAASEGAADAAALFPKEANANRSLFFDRAGAPRSAQALLDRFSIDAPDAIAAQAETPSSASLAPRAASAAALLAVLELQALPNASEDADAPEIALLREGVYRRLLEG